MKQWKSYWAIILSHPCIHKLPAGHHWFRWWLVACLVPIHYLNQCWFIFNGEQTSVKMESKYDNFHSRNDFVNVVCKMAAILSESQYVDATRSSVVITYHGINVIRQYRRYIYGLVLDCSNSSAVAMEFMQFCTKPSIFGFFKSTRCSVKLVSNLGSWVFWKGKSVYQWLNARL